MNNEFISITQYFDCKSKLIGKIATYDLLIEGFEKSILEATVSGHLIQYEMDDGQMKVRTQYRNISDMTDAMNGLRRIRQDYKNQHNGRTTVLRGGNL